MTISALMVDVDGVLVCGRPQDGHHWASSLEVDLGLSRADLQREFFAPYWSDIVIGRADLEACLGPVLPRIAPHLAPDVLIDYWFSNDAQLNQPLLEALDLQREQGINVYLATNQDHLRAAYLVEQLGLSRHCDGIFSSASLGCRKPEPGFFERAGRLSGMAPGELLLVDDLLENVLAARAAGWQALQWMPDSSLEAVLAQVRRI